MLFDAAHLALFFLRLRRVFIGVWVVSIVSLTALFPPVFSSSYPELALRGVLVQKMQSTMSTRAMYGVLENPGTIGQLTAWDGGAWATVLVAVLAVLLFHSMYRAAEDKAHTELIRAAGVPKMMVSVSALLASIYVGAMLGGGCCAALWVEDVFLDELDTIGAVAFGVVTFITYVAFSLLAALVSVLLPSAAGVIRVSLMAVAVAFVLRAVADVEGIAALNWVSPLGWRGVVKPYTDDDFVAAALCGLMCVGWAAVWLVIECGREYGTGRMAARSRRSPRPRRIVGPLSLRWSLVRSQVLTWGIAIALLSAFLTSLTDSLDEFFEADTDFLTQISQFVGIVTSIAAMQLVLRQRRDERDRLVDLVRAVGVRRWVPLGATSIIALFTAIVLIAVGTVAGVVPLIDDAPTAVRSILYGFPSQLGPIIALCGLCVLFVGAVPRYALWAWAPLVYCVIVVFLGEAMELPDWAMNLSVFQSGVSERGWVPFFMAGCGLASAGLGLVTAAHREVW